MFRSDLEVRSLRLKKIVDFCLRLGTEFEDDGKMEGEVSLGGWSKHSLLVVLLSTVPLAPSSLCDSSGDLRDVQRLTGCRTPQQAHGTLPSVLPALMKREVGFLVALDSPQP